MTTIASWTSHPRPQLKREHYAILNGEWHLEEQPIRVPFSPQATISGYQGDVKDAMRYEHTFAIPKAFCQERILLHFGAVDQIAEVKVNGNMVGSHEGGYLPFSFDITEYVNREQENTLEVFVKDDLSQDYPYGKQSKQPKGMWYTSVSGIWQTVWLENVPEVYITDIRLTPSLEQVHLQVNCNQPAETIKVEIILPEGENLCQELTDGTGDIIIPNPVHWTPDHPHLYTIKITADEDCVESYFALRTICIQEVNGVQRVCLNGKPIFLHGVLDQGYFHDGIYLPEQEAAYEKDILAMKELGYNLLRKHIKIEPEYFYYACDKLGMLVMQDMVNNGSYAFVRDTLLPTIGFKKRNDLKLNPSKKVRSVFKEHTRNTIAHLYNHPCIVAYTIFNEGWGQFNSDELYDYVKSLDSTRLVDSTSGWYAQEKNDFDSQHIYFRLKRLQVQDRPLFVTECGGYKYMEKDHFFGVKEYGYGTCKDQDDLTNRIKNMYEKMILPYIKDGVCGCIYTQLSDVEGEINGLYTYDRAVCKVNKQEMQEIARKIEVEIGSMAFRTTSI